jgi:Holliday junction resolvase
VDFQPGQVGYLERSREQCADVLQMGEKTVGIHVTSAAEDLIAVNGEPIEEIFLFARGFSTKPTNPALKASSLPRMNFEIRVKTDEVLKRIHPPSLHRRAKRVEQ